MEAAAHVLAGADESMRKYLLGGGTIVLHSQGGRHEFNESARREFADVLPGRSMQPVDSDHPLYRNVHPIESMRLRRGLKSIETAAPQLEAIHLGVRAAVIFSPVDLSIGWDVADKPIEGGTFYIAEDARKLGVNILSYAMANMAYAQALSVQDAFVADEPPSPSALTIAQLVHGGDWDPTPHAIDPLVRQLKARTTTEVNFGRRSVAFGDLDPARHPIVLMVGLRAFTLTDAEAAAIRAYLAGGGTLIVDNAAGWAGFDVAARTALNERILPGELTPLPATHPIFRTTLRTTAVEYSPVVKAANPELATPTLLGGTVDDRLAVIYSPFGLSRGWEGFADPYSRSVTRDDALALGVNIVTYALTN